MYPATPNDSPIDQADPVATAGDPRVEAFREFLAALDRADSVLTPMRRLRRLGLSVCVVPPRASLRGHAGEAASPALKGVVASEPTGQRPPLLALEVAGHPVAWDDAGDDLADHRGPGRLDDWLTAVTQAALAAVGPRGSSHLAGAFPLTGPVRVDLTFVARPREGEAPGSPWACPVWPNGTKADPSVPDLDSLARATLGALAGIALADVSQVASIAARKVYGPSPGASIAVNAV